MLVVVFRLRCDLPAFRLLIVVVVMILLALLLLLLALFLILALLLALFLKKRVFALSWIRTGVVRSRCS